jgi:ADP-ribose pyrophosphatase YjhB (NUDIX family)
VARTSSGVVGLLAEPDRLRVVSALALGAGTIPEVATAAGMDPRAVVHALRRLERGGLVTRAKEQLTLHAERFKEAARQAAPDEPGEPLSADPATDAVLRAFTRDGRITTLPSSRAKLRLLLGHVVGVFEPGLRYAEGEVNAMLRPWHEDHAMLRRHLHDEGFLDRADGEYWRIGGWVDTGAPPAVGTEAPGVGTVPPDVTGTARAVDRYQRIGAYALVRDGEAVLLSRLGRSVHRGRWTLPGGGLDFGERPADAVVREVYEETGLHVRVGALLDADAEHWRYRYLDADREAHLVRFLYQVTVLGGTLGVMEQHGSTDDAGWWPVHDLPELTPVAERVLRTGKLNP